LAVLHNAGAYFTFALSNGRGLGSIRVETAVTRAKHLK